MPRIARITLIILAIAAWHTAVPAQDDLVKVKYNNPGLIVDLGVGLWAQPFPMDFDKDGDVDLLVATADCPSNGIYFFENPGSSAKLPVFKPGKRIGKAQHNITISYIDGAPHILTPGQRHPEFSTAFLDKPTDIPLKPAMHMGRAKQWKLSDYDGDGATDIILGISDWREYGWDNAFNDKGEWTHGALHGNVYVAKNTGTNEAPAYAEPVQVQAGGKPLDVYGCPSPNFADFDADGDLDLMCGEFLDRITYFENTGTRTEPQYAEGRFLTHNGQVIKMDLEMLQVVAFDWDGDGDIDIIVGQEDGRVAFMEHTGEIADGTPVFLPPVFFRQEAEYLKVGALCTPYSIDWDADGDEDLIVGDTAGYLNFVENLDGANPPKWAPPVYLEAAGQVIRIQAGPNGSIQGPAEAKWGYTVLNAADWDHDGLPDIIINSIWGKILWYRNIGSKTEPQLAPAQPIEVEWEGPAPKPKWFWWNPQGKELITQWRTTPFIIDLNADGLNDLVMLDQEGYLAFFERSDGKLLPPKRIFMDEKRGPLRLNDGEAGKSGRRKFTMADWDQDGKLDILINSRCIDFMRNIAEKDGEYVFKNEGQVHPHRLAGHTTCPTIVDWDKNNIPDLLIGAEDGFLYYMPNPQ